MAFWRRKDNAADTHQDARPTLGTPPSKRVEPVDIVRVRARRRLIGAAALLLTVAIVVPMVLDPEPRPASDNIAIDIPSEKTPFTPRLALPPVPAPENVPVAPPPESQPPAAKAEEPPTKAVDGKKVEEQRARALLEGKSKAGPAAQTIRRPGSQCRLRLLRARQRHATCRAAEKSRPCPIYRKGGYEAGGALRVRLGPYA